MNDIMKIVKSLKDAGLLRNRLTGTGVKQSNSSNIPYRPLLSPQHH